MITTNATRFRNTRKLGGGREGGGEG